MTPRKVVRTWKRWMVRSKQTGRVYREAFTTRVDALMEWGDHVTGKLHKSVELIRVEIREVLPRRRTVK